MPLVCDLFHRSNVEAFSSSGSFAIGRASAAPVAPPALRRLERSLSQRPTPENDAEIVGRRFREETTALRPSATSIGRCFFASTTSCDAAPRSHTGLGPLAASLLGSHGFAAVGPGTTPFQTGSIPPRFFRAMVAAGSRFPFTSRFFLTQDASLNLSAAYRLLQRVFNYDARTHFCELDPRPPQGTALRALPLVVAPFGAARSLLLDGRVCVPDVPQRATRFSPTSGLETQTPPAETGAPSDDAF